MCTWVSVVIYKYKKKPREMAVRFTAWGSKWMPFSSFQKRSFLDPDTFMLVEAPAGPLAPVSLLSLGSSACLAARPLPGSPSPWGAQVHGVKEHDFEEGLCWMARGGDGTSS